MHEIDHRQIGEGKAGPVTLKLQDAFDELTRGRHARSNDWLWYVSKRKVAVQ